MLEKNTSDIASDEGPTSSSDEVAILKNKVKKLEKELQITQAKNREIIRHLKSALGLANSLNASVNLDTNGVHGPGATRKLPVLLAEVMDVVEMPADKDYSQSENFQPRISSLGHRSKRPDPKQRLFTTDVRPISKRNNIKQHSEKEFIQTNQQQTRSLGDIIERSDRVQRLAGAGLRPISKGRIVKHTRYHTVNNPSIRHSILKRKNRWRNAMIPHATNEEIRYEEDSEEDDYKTDDPKIEILQPNYDFNIPQNPSIGTDSTKRIKIGEVTPDVIYDWSENFADSAPILFNNYASFASGRNTNGSSWLGPGREEQWGEEEIKYAEMEGERETVERSMLSPIAKKEQDMKNNIVDSNELYFIERPPSLSGLLEFDFLLDGNQEQLNSQSSHSFEMCRRSSLNDVEGHSLLSFMDRNSRGEAGKRIPTTKHSRGKSSFK